MNASVKRLFAGLIAVLPMAVHATDDLVGPDMRTAAQRQELLCSSYDDDRVQSIRHSLDKVSYLPGIPPEEDAYLKSELAGYLDMTRPSGPTVESQRRYERFTSRRLYLAWEARNALHRVQDAVRKIIPEKESQRPIREMRDMYFSKDANSLQGALDAMWPAAEFATALEKFREYENRTVDRLISTQQNNEILAAELLTYDLARYASCKLAKLPVR